MFKLIGKKKRGFTLIELIVVIAILAILAAIAIPSFIGITDNADAAVNTANAKLIATAINTGITLDRSTIADEANIAAAKVAAGDFWPEDLSAEQETEAFDLVTISGNVAKVNE